MKSNFFLNIFKKNAKLRTAEKSGKLFADALMDIEGFYNAVDQLLEHFRLESITKELEKLTTESDMTNEELREILKGLLRNNTALIPTQSQKQEQSGELDYKTINKIET